VWLRFRVNLAVPRRLAWTRGKGGEEGGQRLGQWGWGVAMRWKGEGGSGHELRAAPRPAGAGRRCERARARETGADAWAPTAQCRAAARIQIFSNRFN
jgi:hypothetical protein